MLVVFGFALKAQPLRDINYNYLYDPGHSFSFFTTAARSEDQWKIAYALELKDTTTKLNDLSIQWELRKDLGEKEGEIISTGIHEKRNRYDLSGIINLPSSTSGSIVVAKVVRITANQAWIYYHYLEPKNPVNTLLQTVDGPYLTEHVDVGNSLSLADSGKWIASFYNDNFPAAAPAFSETQARVSPRLRVDSLARIEGGTPFRFFEKGLYLFQQDTSVAEGIAILAHDDYPRFSRVQNLPGPFIYICTKQEYDKLEASNGDKKTFDRTVLTITGDANRARTLIKNYFRRVELANTYFTSYKEGWKTDRGMIYIIFGLPEQVFRFGDREVWKYDNADVKVTFNFTKAPTLFDPDNYVLIRDNRYRERWYQVVDLWRNARL